MEIIHAFGFNTYYQDRRGRQAGLCVCTGFLFIFTVCENLSVCINSFCTATAGIDVISLVDQILTLRHAVLTHVHYNDLISFSAGASACILTESGFKVFMDATPVRSIEVRAKLDTACILSGLLRISTSAPCLSCNHWQRKINNFVSARGLCMPGYLPQ